MVVKTGKSQRHKGKQSLYRFFTAIQQGTIDGQENGCSVTKSAKMDEI